MSLEQVSVPLYLQAACPASPPAFSVGSAMETLWSTGPRVTIRPCVAASSMLINSQELYGSPQEDTECNNQGRHRLDRPMQNTRAGVSN